MAFQRFRWLLVLIVGLLITPAPLLALQPTPTAADTQLYIGHSARLTAQIPADWDILPDGSAAYGSNDGLFFSSVSMGETLIEACEISAESLAAETSFTTNHTTWNGEPACEIELPESILGTPLAGLVLPHPEPFDFQGLRFSYIEVFGTPGALEDMLSTISFDLSGLSGPDIAHSILDIAEAYAYYTDGVDWTALRSVADSVQSPDEVPTFINLRLLRALYEAGDNHSHLGPPISADADQHPLANDVPTGDMRGNLGYIDIPAGTLPSNADAYATAGIEVITELEMAGVCGWIVDLRDNTGGGVPVMIQPFLPFLPEGDLVGFVWASGEEQWVVREGDQLMLATPEYTVPYGGEFSASLPTINNPDAPIAVLLSPQTLSAGEYTLLTLMGRENTRSFGEPTGGRTTGNVVYPMLDGSTLALAVSAAIDVDGTVYTGKIDPDELIGSQATGGDPHARDRTILAAEAWLLAQPACQNTATPTP